MKTRSSLLLATLALLTTTAPALHAQLNPALVPADSKWVAYADFKALLSTELGQHLIERLPLAREMGGDSPIFPDVNKTMAIIDTVTAFGDTFTPDVEQMNGVLLIQGNDQLRTIAEGLVAQFSLSHPNEIIELTDLPFEAHRVHNEVVIGFPPEPLVIVSRSPEKLLAALAVYRGQAPSLAGGSHQLTQLLPTETNYYLYAASMVPAEHLQENDNSPQARIFQMTQAAAVSIGEAGDLAEARATLVAGDASVADKLVKILNGLTAMLSLAETDDANLSAFINSVSVRREGLAVGLRLAYPTARLVDMIEQQARGQAPSMAPSPAQPAAVEGELIATWVADAELGFDAPAQNNFAVFTSEPVALRPGTRLILTSALERGERGRVDYIELIPVGNGAGGTQRHEAEFMRLANYEIESSEFASGREAIVNAHGGPSTAQLRYNGAAGDYRVRVCYVDENDGTSTFQLSLVHPAD